MKLVFNGKQITSEKPVVMGILNVTPDSFFDGGKYLSEKEWIARTKTMLDEGAEIVDVGAMSTRPGAKSISEKEELDRLVKPIQILTDTFPEIIISVDTYRQKVAEKCLSVGATIINDISGGTFDAKMLDFIGQNNVPYVLMHTSGTPENMQDKPIEKDVVPIVLSFFEKQTEKLFKFGNQQIILDPGFGFGKSVASNYQLLNGLTRLKINELPILVGVSRKSMINKVIETAPEDALNGTTVLNTLALMNDADILRVHDVKAAKEAIVLCEFLKKHSL